MKRRASIILAAALLAAGCSKPLAHGYVTSKEYQPAYIDHTGYFQCAAYDKNGACTVHIWIPEDISHPADWILCLREQVNNKAEKGCISVPQATFDAYRVGDHYPEPR
jgi:hypothetical protein